jgi:hypothetical protein
MFVEERDGVGVNAPHFACDARAQHGVHDQIGVAQRLNKVAKVLRRREGLNGDAEVRGSGKVDGSVTFQLTGVGEQKGLDGKADVVQVARQCQPVAAVVALATNDDDAFGRV